MTRILFKPLLSVISIFIMLGCLGCQSTSVGMGSKGKVNLRSCISAPPGYEMWTVDGYVGYLNAQDEVIGGFWARSGDGGWGMCGTEMSGDLDQYPARVHLRWFSVAENQFYDLDAKLPVEKMRQIYEKGFQNWLPITRDGEKLRDYQTFSRIQFMLAPGGGVVVKLYGAEAREIAYFKANKVDMPWHEFQKVSNESATPRNVWVKDSIDDLAKSRPAVHAQIVGNKIPYGLWDEVYRRVYPWQLSMSGVKSFENYYVEYLNTEKYMVWPEDMAQFASTPKSAPQALELYFIGQNGTRYRGEVTFNDVVVAQKCHEFYKHSQDPARLNIRVSEDLKTAEITLSDALRSIAIPYQDWKVKVMPVGKY